jgi:hypothetical protein
MYNSPFARIKCVVDGYHSSTASHIKNLVLVINGDLHLVNSQKSVHAKSNLDFLFNLSGDPIKAYNIIKSIKSILQKLDDVGLLGNEKKEFYFELMDDGVNHNFRNDSTALIYVERLIKEISILIEDNNQFSEFNYF